MHYISDIVTDPQVPWKVSHIPRHKNLQAVGIREGVKIQVAVEPAGADIVTAYPIP